MHLYVEVTKFGVGCHLFSFYNLPVKRLNVWLVHHLLGVSMFIGMKGTELKISFKFCYLTAREEDGVNELHKLGFKNAELMPDPTLLLHMNDYSYLEENESKLIPKDKYLFLYLLGNPIGIDVKDIFDFAKQRNLKIVYVASQGRKDVFPKVTPTIGEWLSLIKNSDYVITNSFHGTVFSLQYHKKLESYL